MGDLGIAPICLSTFPVDLLAKILERWRARDGRKAEGAILPIRFAEEICPRYSRAMVVVA